MSSSESDSDIDGTPPHLKAEAELAKNNLLPPKSKERYLKNYEKFIKWKEENKANNWSENVFLAYFNHLRQIMQPSSLWAVYSVLRCVVLNKENVNIKNYTNLIAWLKRQSNGYKGKKSQIFNSQNIQKFLNDAPDDKYLVMKVVLIMGVNGACRSIELSNIVLSDVEFHNEIIVVKLRETKTKLDRSFVIQGEFVNIVKKYYDMRPTDMKSDFFYINYKNGKCMRQNIGRHKIAAMPKEIAIFLHLKNPETYTGHCFRRSSATLLADSGANLTTIKRHGGWKSDRVAEGYIEESIENKSEITTNINKRIRLDNSYIKQPSISRQECPSIISQPSTSRQEYPSMISQPSTSRQMHPTIFPQPSTSRQEYPSMISRSSTSRQMHPTIFPQSSTSHQERPKIISQWPSSPRRDYPIKSQTNMSPQEPPITQPVKSPQPSTSRQMTMSQSQTFTASQESNSDIQQTNINVPGKSIKISISKCPHMNVTFNIS